MRASTFGSGLHLGPSPPQLDLFIIGLIVARWIRGILGRVCWADLWKLNIITRVKVFTWRMVHGWTPTFSYLYMLNIGPDKECCFCGLERETDEHLLWKCKKIQLSWYCINNYAGVDLTVISNFTNGDQITKTWETRQGNQNLKAALANCAWLLWKA